MLVVGATGSGKTALSLALLTSLCMFNSTDAVQIQLIDPKGRGLGPLTRLPDVQSQIVGHGGGPRSAEPTDRSDGESAIQQVSTPTIIVAVH